MEEPTASKPASVQEIVLSPNAYRITAGLTEQNRLGSTFVRHMLIVRTSWSKLNAGRIQDLGAQFEFLTLSIVHRDVVFEASRIARSRKNTREWTIGRVKLVIKQEPSGFIKIRGRVLRQASIGPLDHH